MVEGRQAAQRYVAADGWLFPGRSATDPISTRQINRAIHEAAEAAGIRKRVSPHTLRHSFATHLLEQDVDIRVIQVLLGHSKLDTTALYARVATMDAIRSVTSPLERLALLMEEQGSRRLNPLVCTSSSRSPTSSGLKGTAYRVAQAGHLKL